MRGAVRLQRRACARQGCGPAALARAVRVSLGEAGRELAQIFSSGGHGPSMVEVEGMGHLLSLAPAARQVWFPALLGFLREHAAPRGSVSEGDVAQSDVIHVIHE